MGKEGREEEEEKEGRKERGREGERKNLLLREKEGSKKAGLQLNIQKLRPWHLVPSIHEKKMEKKWKQW